MKSNVLVFALSAAMVVTASASRGESATRPLKFLLMSDTHVESDYIERGRPVYTCWKPGNHAGLIATYEFINTNSACRDIDLALFCGDQLNTGYSSQQRDLQAELVNYYRTLTSLDLYKRSRGTDVSSLKFVARPYSCAENVGNGIKPFSVEPPPLDSRVIAIQGNHDTGIPSFYRDCAFQCGDVKFVTFFASYVGLPAPKGQYRSTAKIADETVAFLEREMASAAADSSIKHIVMLCHWAMVADDPKNFICPIRDAMKENGFNDNRGKVLALAEKYGCKLFINGHEHNGNWPVGRIGGVYDINCGAVSDDGSFAIVEMHSDKAVFTIYSTAVAEEKDGVCRIVRQPARLFERVIPLKPVAAERVPLFNGKDLSGWTAVTDYNVTGGYTASEPTWAVVDGCIRSTGTPFGYLRTERKDYADYKLHVEYRWWRPTEKPNSGVFVRIASDTGTFLPSCVENQLCAGKAGDLLGIWGTSFDGLPPNSKHKFLINVKDKQNPSSEKPFGEWNTIEIVAKGGKIENWVNGVKQNSAAKLTTKCGAIALQSEGGAIEFRNVWIEEDGVTSQPVTIKADFSRTTGAVKPMHGIGQPPMIGWDWYSMFLYLREAGIPFSRLHDVGGHHGRNVFVDIPNIFRDFEADENDPKNYDFAFTDELLNSLVKNGVEPFFRLGVTIENRSDIRAYRIFPPKDYAKWARVCEHVIRHYTEGWANGYKWKIRYWEIWNEPDNDTGIADNTYWKGPGTPYKSFNAMWAGTWQQYMEFYDVVSKYLKGRFPHLKIGGYASCGFYAAANSPAVAAANSSPRTQYFVDCYLEFLKFAKERKSPLDFFSFHTYSDVKEALRQIDWGIETLHQYGFTNTETTVNEWLPRVSAESLGTASQASAICAEMIGMQHSKLDSAMIYDGRCGMGNYSPLFDPATRKPRKAYYALKAFNEAYKLKTATAVSVSNPEIHALAAGTEKGGVILIANSSNRRMPLKLDLGALKVTSCTLTDETHTYAEVQLPSVLPRESFILLHVASK